MIIFRSVILDFSSHLGTPLQDDTRIFFLIELLKWLGYLCVCRIRVCSVYAKSHSTYAQSHSAHAQHRFVSFGIVDQNSMYAQCTLSLALLSIIE